LKSLKIFLGDLTYDTITLATESFPLNIGFVASYCLSKYPNNVDIKLFKYIDKIEKAIEENPPDVLGLSNYAWNRRIGLEIFRIFKKNNPNGITVWGGPNFPLDLESQKIFMKKHPEIDVYVPVEGEVGFSNFIGKILESDSKEEIFMNPIEGCIIRDKQDNLQYSNPGIRIKSLDEIPSPYTNGLLDEFFDGKLSPMFQTNRGCPFTCSFCVDGADVVRQVNNFGMDRIVSDLNYIADHVPNNTHSLFISDLNFGMIPRDIEICKILAKLKDTHGFPKQIQATTGKNSKEKIIKAIKELHGALRIYMSVQSLDEKVLTNIRRSNISPQQLIALAPTIKEANLRTTSEVILGLPGESYQSHVQTLRDLVKAKMDDIQVYTCMMLDGAEMNTPKEREKWGLQTKFRLLPRDFTKLSNGKKVMEIEEVIVSSNTLTFKEYVELRLLAFALWVTNKGIVYDPILKFLRQNKIDAFELFNRIHKNLEFAPSSIKQIFKEFENATIKELWDSPEEIENHYQNEKEYQKLIDGEDGINVMYYFHGKVVSTNMDDWTNYTLEIAQDLLLENKKMDNETLEQFENISNYCRGISHNPLGEDRNVTNPKFNFNYDIQKWINENSDKNLKEFKFSKIQMEFVLSNEQIKLVEDKLTIFGNTPSGRSQAIKRIPIQMLWRIPKIIAQ
jgi:radical SAM superfamily enzyme YgiQ (UPF0313 family)